MKNVLKHIPLGMLSMFVLMAILGVSCVKAPSTVRDSDQVHKNADPIAFVYTQIAHAENEGIQRTMFNALSPDEMAAFWRYKVRLIETSEFTPTQAELISELYQAIDVSIYRAKETPEAHKQWELDWRSRALQHFTRDEVYKMAYAFPELTNGANQQVSSVAKDSRAVPNCDCISFCFRGACNTPAPCSLTVNSKGCGVFGGAVCIGQCRARFAGA